jgi:c-di-GMP-binding flagellar brake protein YcgR
MEKRWSLRKPIALDVVLYHTDAGLLRCRTRDISLEGMFVTTGAVNLQIDDPVELDFILHSNGDSQLHHIRAKVVRLTEQGAGLMYREFTPNITHFLQDAQYNA